MCAASIHDRMLAVYRGQMPDRIPVGIYDRYLTRGTVEREVRQLGAGIIAYMPVVSMLGPPWHLYPQYLSEIRGADFHVRFFWDNGVMVKRHTYTTPVGTVWQDITEDRGGAGSEHIRRHYITRRDDYRVVKYLVENTVIRSNEEAIRDRMRDLDGDGIVLGRLDRNPYQKCLIELAGPERFLMDLHTDPEPVLALMDAISRKHEESFAMALESSVEVLWQPDNTTSLLTPPSAYQQHCLPFYQRRTALARQAGKPYLVHMDGQLRALAPLIQESGFDVLESFSLPDIGGDMSLDEAQATWPEIVIAPNIPGNWALRSHREIEALIEELVASARRGAPLILQVSEDYPPGDMCKFLSAIMCAVNASQADIRWKGAGPPAPHRERTPAVQGSERHLRT